MCGIIGCCTDCGASEKIFHGLCALEYRGYDSAGISVLDGGKITTVKRAGRVEGIRESALKLAGGVAIGHTRWATHGAPTDANAHPHTRGKFAVAHNGIIENFRELKEELEGEKFEFKSDTDSEVVAALLELYYGGNLLSAVAKTVARLKGSFALAILCADFCGLVAVKYKSPVVVGLSAEGCYCASDVPALPPSVVKIMLPEDGDIAVITRGGASFFDFSLRPVCRPASVVNISPGETGLCGYPHYMLKEICENARTVRETADAFSRNADLMRLKRYALSADRIIFVGCGTAYNSGLVAARFFGRTCSAQCSVEIASEARYFPPKVTPRTLVIAVSQSGETADTVEAAIKLKEGGARVVAVTNVGYSAVTRIAHAVLPVCARSEICVAATKSYIGQLTALYLYASLCGREGAEDELCKIAELLEQGVCTDGDAEKLAEACASSRAVFFLGRGADYDVAREGSLKLKEISYVFSSAYPAGELKHGTLALVDESTLSIVLITDLRLAEKCENAVEQITSRKGRVAVVTTLDGVYERLKKDVECAILLPQCPTELSPFLTAACLQLVAYKAAVILGRDPDKPRNLAKSVTVE